MIVFFVEMQLNKSNMFAVDRGIKRKKKKIVTQRRAPTTLANF